MKQRETAAAEEARTEAVREDVETAAVASYGTASPAASEVRAAAVEPEEEQHQTLNPTQPPPQQLWLEAAEAQHAGCGRPLRR